MKKIFLTLNIIGLIVVCHGQNLLTIPDTLSGTNFSLNIYDTSKVFYSGFTTNTHGVNANYLGPTLFFNKGDSVNIHVNNHLQDTTTIHWHGLHVSAPNDGGPRIVILPNKVWNPKFKVRDQAATYWYHPHLHGMTNLHAALGMGGVIIVRDTLERVLDLPRRYSVDDFPLVIQSKCFDVGKQIVIDNPYDSVMMVNGTRNAYLPTPAQVVRLRLLNASSERVYYIGFQGNLTFYQIATDGGLLNVPVALTRLRLAPGERGEILIDFSGKMGQIINLMSFASELPSGIYGALQPGMGIGQGIPGYNTNPLNGTDFNIMKFNIVVPTASPVTTIPSSLITNTPWAIGSANSLKTLTFSPVNMGPTAIQGPFVINNKSFDINVINYSIPLNNIEIWTLNNQTPIAHPFHIHDVQFYITEINGSVPPPNMTGRKDVVLVPAMQTVKFITKFETFCDTTTTYMYHCHMLPHEDNGMMGQFVVKCPITSDVNKFDLESSDFLIYPNPSSGKFTVKGLPGRLISQITVFDYSGKAIMTKSIVNSNEVAFNLDLKNSGIYFLEIKTPEGVVYKKLNLIK